MGDTKKTILYVDDEEVNLFLFSKIFENDFNILTALSGEEGLKKLGRSNDIRIVISDLRMPAMDGLEFVDAAKKKSKDLSCFILTGYELNPDLEVALKTKRVDKVFKKPFDYELIKSAVED